MLKQILTNPTIVSIISGQLRHIGGAAGAALAAKGLIEGGQVETVAGIIATIGAMILSALAKKV
jgi:hypothetical protein